MNETSHTIPAGTKVILFDGVCNLCNNAVSYIIKRDKNRVFRYASLQSELGKELVRERGIDVASIDSIILIDPGTAYYIKSTAALEISKALTGIVSWLQVFLFLPEGFRDSIYDFIARNRYRWFGKNETCALPTQEEQSLFLS